MAGWLSVAEKLFRSGTTRTPQPFEVICACGQTVAGLRTDGVQTRNCPNCGVSLFILPVSVYPLPKTPKRNLVTAPAPKEEPVPDPAVEADRIAGLPPKVGKLKGTARVIEKPAPEVKKPPGPPRRPVKQVLREAVVSLELDRHCRRIFRPVRLVLVAVIGVIGLTGWWLVHQQRRDAAERLIVSAVKLGEQALADHDLVEAARQFQQVRAALDVLGRNDHQSRALRQTARETTAAADLSRSSLFDLLHEAVESESGKVHLTWDETFRTGYRDEWVVVDAMVSRLAENAGGRRFEIDFPLTEGRHRAILVADLDAFDKVLAAGQSPQRVVFAGQLDECRKHEETWLIALRPSTGFLWSSAANLELLGVPLDDATKQLLADQTGQLGLAE
jgi:hypothetical protein